MKAIRYFTTFATMLILSLVGFGQDEKKVDVNIDLNKDGGSTWYQQPWVWVVGAAVFILLLVAILKSGRRSEA